MNLQLPKVISKDLARQVIQQIIDSYELDIMIKDDVVYSAEEVLAILFPDD